MVSDYRRNQAWVAGKKAAEQGKPAGANNRQEGTIYYDDWSDGWLYFVQSQTSKPNPND